MIRSNPFRCRSAESLEFAVHVSVSALPAYCFCPMATTVYRRPPDPVVSDVTSRWISASVRSRIQFTHFISVTKKSRSHPHSLQSR